MKVVPAFSAVALLLFLPASLVAQDNLAFGARAGAVGPGCVYVEDSDCFESDVNYSFGGYLDYLFAERISGGVFLDLHGISGEGTEDTENMIDVGATIKGIILASGGSLTFRPGIGVGYGAVTVADEDVNFLTLRGMLEALFDVGGLRLGVEGGVFTGPSGGNEDLDVTFGPGFLARAIIEF